MNAPYSHQGGDDLAQHFRSALPPPTGAPTFDVERVRRRDVRRLYRMGPPPGAPLPASHAVEGDPRYPSPRALRQVLSFIIDLAVHLAVAAGAFAGTSLVTDSAGVLAAALCGFLGASLVHRILVQRLVQATLGKALTGLCVIRDDTGGPPTTWSLVKDWFLGLISRVFDLLT